jgi:hypothetical protein
VELDGLYSELARELYDIGLRIDEKTHSDSRVLQALYRFIHAVSRGGNIQTALGCDFLTPLWNERHLVRAYPLGNGYHLRHARKLEIEKRSHVPSQPADVVVLNVSAVLPKMGSDAIRAGFLARKGGGYWIRFQSAPCLPQCRDVIDVHVEALVSCSHYRRGLRFRLMLSTVRPNAAVAVLALLLACAPPPPAGQVPGAPSPRLAVEQFLNAARAEDIQAMTAVWGTSRGPARETMERTELERRAIILQCFVTHDSFRVVGESPGQGGRRVFGVVLVRGNRSRQTSIYAIAGPGRRWYVENVDLASIRDFCGAPVVQPTPGE